MSKPQILFVDDEASVLAGIRRLLRKHENDWDVHLRDNAADALALLDQLPVDVLVTDMRMPGTDGVALLDQARCLHPGTARLVLSGHADPTSIIAAAGPTQQFLSKPCEPEELERVLARVVGVVRLMDDPQLRALIGGQKNLPKPPSVYTELTALLTTPEPAVKDVANLIEHDVACSTEILKLVNSSFFGLATEVTSIERAVSLLGLDVIHALVLAGSLFTPSRRLPADLDAQRLGDRGLAACLQARRIARLERWDEASTGQIGLAALLRDVGLLVLAVDNPAHWNAYRSAADTVPLAQRQTAAFGCTVGRASAYLLGLWGFATPIVTAVANQPLDLDDPTTTATATPAELLVAYAHLDDPRQHPLAGARDGAYLNPGRLAAWEPGLSVTPA